MNKTKIINIDDKEDVYLMGDIHGEVSHFFNTKIENSTFIILGDIGAGFSASLYEHLNNLLGKHNNNALLIRGNHDNPKLWEDEPSYILEKEYPNIGNIQDHDIIEYRGEKYLCFGGGTSIDRSFRKEGKSYWKDEEIQPIPNIPIEGPFNILSHVGPIPPDLGTDLSFFFNHDDKLRDTLREEAERIDEILNRFKPKNWFYGHYHFSQTFKIEDTTCSCLKVKEIMKLN